MQIILVVKIVHIFKIMVSQMFCNFMVLGNGNDAVLHNTVLSDGPFGRPAVTFTGADDQ